MDPKETKQVYSLLSKMTNIFSSFYIIKPGFIITKDIERPFLIQIENEWVELFEKLFGQFTVVYVYDIKILKKVLAGPKAKDNIKIFPKLEDQFYLVSQKRELDEIKSILMEKMNSISECKKWESFILSENPDQNESLLKSLFTDNNYINFKPQGEDSPVLILTKSLIPLVTEKNYNKLYYSAKKVNDGLYMIIFDFQFDLFRLYMYHYYIPIEKSD